MRIRADKAVNGLRAAILRAVLVRNRSMEVPVALDLDNRNKGYLLGRLFAVYEEVQRAALGKVNASIRDKCYGAASATPQKVFALLERGSASHLGKVRKESPGREVNLRRELAAIMETMSPGDSPFPAALSAE
jgi:CRISPR-associated protein Csd1